MENADGKHAVVDWHGAQIVDFELEYNVALYGVDCLYTGSAIYKLPR